MDWIRQHVSRLCKQVRQEAIPLVDSFNLSDYVINSPLGRKDGNVYQHYFDMIQHAHTAGAIPSYFSSEVRYDDKLISRYIHYCIGRCKMKILWK